MAIIIIPTFIIVNAAFKIINQTLMNVKCNCNGDSVNQTLH